jgi:hypothetical protein
MPGLFWTSFAQGSRHSFSVVAALCILKNGLFSLLPGQMISLVNQLIFSVLKKLSATAISLQTSDQA